MSTEEMFDTQQPFGGIPSDLESETGRGLGEADIWDSGLLDLPPSPGGFGSLEEEMFEDKRPQEQEVTRQAAETEAAIQAEKARLAQAEREAAIQAEKARLAQMRKDARKKSMEREASGDERPSKRLRFRSSPPPEIIKIVRAMPDNSVNDLINKVKSLSKYLVENIEYGPKATKERNKLAINSEIDMINNQIRKRKELGKTIKVGAFIGTGKDEINWALGQLMKFDKKSVKGDVYSIRGDRRRFFLGKSDHPLKSELIRGIVERDASSAKQGEILYQSNEVKKKRAPPLNCWGTNFPCTFNCIKSGINHEMEHVIPSSQQATIGSLCQRDNLSGQGQNERGENSIHNVLLHKIMENLELEPKKEMVYGIKNLMKYSQHFLGLPSIELFNQAKCSRSLIEVTFPSWDKFPTPKLKTNEDMCKKIANLMILGREDGDITKASRVLKDGNCNSDTLLNPTSGLYYRGPKFGMCLTPERRKATPPQPYTREQKEEAKKILEQIGGDKLNPNELAKIIKANCDKVCDKYNDFMGEPDLNGENRGCICFAFSLLLMGVILTAALRGIEKQVGLAPPDNTPLLRLADKAKLYLKSLAPAKDSGPSVFKDLATRFGGVMHPPESWAIDLFKKNNNDEFYEEWLSMQRPGIRLAGGSLPDEEPSEPDDEPSELKDLNEKGSKGDSLFAHRGKEEQVGVHDKGEIMENKSMSSVKSEYMEEFLEDYNYLIKELKEIEDFMGEDFMISLFTCDLRMKRKKKPRTKKKKPSKKKPKKTVFGKKKKKKKVTPSKKKKAQKKQPKKKKQTKKKVSKKSKKSKKQSQREIVIDLSGIRDLVSK